MKKSATAGFLAAALAITLLAVCLAATNNPRFVRAFMHGLSPVALLAGAVTITYKFPVTATPTTAPANPPVGEYNTVRATVKATADADTTADVVHNMGLTTEELAEAQPEVSLTPLNAAYYTSAWVASFPDGNTVRLTKGTGGGSGNAADQVGVVIKRPHSIQV